MPNLNQRGFTLVEVAVSVVAMSITAAALYMIFALVQQSNNPQVALSVLDTLVSTVHQRMTQRDCLQYMFGASSSAPGAGQSIAIAGVDELVQGAKFQTGAGSFEITETSLNRPVTAVNLDSRGLPSEWGFLEYQVKAKMQNNSSTEIASSFLFLARIAPGSPPTVQACGATTSPNMINCMTFAGISTPAICNYENPAYVIEAMFCMSLFGQPCENMVPAIAHGTYSLGQIQP